MSKRSIYILGLLLSVLVYELPSLLTLAKTGWQPLPPVLVADQMLYLNLSAIHHVSANEVLNPWYGTRVLAVDVPHLMFPVTFVLFRFVHSIFVSWSTAMLVWSALWTALTFAAAAFCLESFFPDSDRSLTRAGAFALLVLQSPLIYLGQLRQLPSLHGFLTLPLPYLRFAIPQVILPVALAYWGLQVRALKSPSRAALAGMALLQFAMCAAFPYTLPILAIGTGITLVIARRRPTTIALTWPIALAYAALCGLLDIGYLILAGFGKSHANVHFALQFRPEMIVPAIRPYMLVLIVASVLTLFSRASLEVRATVAGLALSNALLGFADVFFAPEAQMLQHPFYIVGITTWLPLFVLLWPVLEKANNTPLRTAIVSGLVILAIWEGFASFKTMLPVNAFQAAVIRQVEPLSLTAQDLVISPSRFSDDVSSWIPLLSSARVLFTGDGENILSASDTRTQQTSRQAIYLMTTGMNLASLNSRTEVGSSSAEIRPLLQQTDQTYAGSKRAKDQADLRHLLRERLGPMVSQFEADPSTTRTILAAYRRIVVVDSSENRFFDESAFSKWLTVDSSYEASGVKVYICHFRFLSRSATPVPRPDALKPNSRFPPGNSTAA